MDGQGEWSDDETSGIINLVNANGIVNTTLSANPSNQFVDYNLLYDTNNGKRKNMETYDYGGME